MTERVGWILGLGLATAACGGEATPTPTASFGASQAEKAAYVASYAELVHQAYTATVTHTELLDAALEAYVAAPSTDTLAAAKQAWIDARAVYGQTEAFRFYGGPIDDADGPEGQINAWPMDEAYVDYVRDGADGAPMLTGIINDPVNYPDISAAVLADANEAEGEESISTGWHAIEFLLWGQDFYTDTAGRRPITDYTPDSGEAIGEPERRGLYLLTASALLLADLRAVSAEWEPGTPGTYREAFEADDPDVSLQKILRGIGALAGGELSGERMYTAYETKDQEDEHDCFSDNTHNALYANGLGIADVWRGEFGGWTGTGLRDLVEMQDPALASALDDAVDGSLTALGAIPAPFDQAIVGGDDAPGRQAVYSAVTVLIEEADLIADVATAFGLSISLSV